MRSFVMGLVRVGVLGCRVSRLCVLGACVLGACACSDAGSPEAGVGALMAGGAAPEVAAGGASNAGQAGDSEGPSPAGAPGGESSGGSTAEGVNVMVPLDSAGPGAAGGTAQAGATSSPQVSAGGDAGSPLPPSSVCPPGPFPASPLPPGATPQAVCTGMTFTEGAVWFQQLGTLFFSDFAIGDAASNFDGRILSYTPGGTCEPFIANAGTNGLGIAPDGNLLGCRHSDQTLTLFELETRQPSVLVADNAGLAFNSPNDVAVRSDGNLYFTDPEYMRGNRAAEQPMRAYRRDPSGALSVIDEAANPNGITLSPDETRLYLSHLGGPNDVVVFDVDATGAVTNRQPFANVGSDGMAIDCAGNLYVTQGGVQVYDPSGQLLGTLAAPGAANVAFGGPERRTLYITARGTLFAVELAIPGLPW